MNPRAPLLLLVICMLLTYSAGNKNLRVKPSIGSRVVQDNVNVAVNVPVDEETTTATTIPVILQMLVPKRNVALVTDVATKNSKAVKMESKSNSLLFELTQKLYPNHFFLHMHCPKTGGTTFKQIFDKTDNKNSNCGYPNSNYASNVPIGKLVDSADCTYFSYEMREVDACATNKEDDCLLGNHVSKYKCATSKCIVGNMNNRYKAKTDRQIHVMNLFRNPVQLILSAISHIASGYSDKNGRCRNLHEYVNSEGNCTTYPIDNMQTHVMSHPISIEVALQKLKKLFFVGVLELYDPSICVLGYQLGQFDSKRCNCTNNLKVGFQKNVHHYSSHDSSSVIRAEDLKIIDSHTLLDNILYAEALQMTLARIAYVEKKTGVQLMCKGERESQLGKYASKKYVVSEQFV